MSNTKLAIKSNFIYLNPFEDPISGIILISNEKIQKIIINSKEKIAAEELANYNVIDAENSFVFPGIIDINVHLNSTFEENWEDIIETTKMALRGGITTIIDNPILNEYDETNNEDLAIKKRVKKIEDNIFTDCGLLSNLGNHNYKDFDKLLENNKYVFGFKIYFSPCFQNNLNYLKRDRLNRVKKICQNIQKKTFFNINCELANERDLFMSSPLRNSNLGLN